MAANSNVVHTDKVKLTLSGENASEFWKAAWENNFTGWRDAEKQPFFTRNLYVCACNTPGAADVVSLPVPYVVEKADHEANRYNGPAEEAVVTAFLKGKAVLVPLCGDTAAVRYMADHGAALVVGADVAPESLLLLRQTHFGEVAFAANPLTLPGGGSVIMYEGLKDGCTIRLFEGDFLALTGVPEFSEGKIDFVYDRASMMAMHPSMRSGYVATVAACLTPAATLIVERPIRDEGDLAGPPFTFFPGQVRDLYATATGRDYAVDTILSNQWYGNAEPGSAHYFEFMRVSPKLAVEAASTSEV